MSLLNSITLKLNFNESKANNIVAQPLSLIWHFEINPLKLFIVETNYSASICEGKSVYFFQNSITNNTDEDIAIKDISTNAKKGFEVVDSIKPLASDLILEARESVSILAKITSQALDKVLSKGLPANAFYWRSND